LKNENNNNGNRNPHTLFRRQVYDKKIIKNPFPLYYVVVSKQERERKCGRERERGVDW
jgi:hypothetical protein